MRVLHIGKFYPPFAGGMENFLGDLLPALQSNGVDVAAVVHDHAADRSRRVFSDSLIVRDHQGTGSPTVYRVPCLGSLLYAPVSPGFPFILRQVISRFKPDILHLHMPNTSAFWVMVLPCARRIPWVVHWHSDVVASEIDRRMAVSYRLYRPFEQRLLKRAGSIVATSRPYLETSKALAPWRNKCKVVELGMDPDRLNIPDNDFIEWAETVWKEKKARVLAIGRLTYYKGHEILIEAAAHAPDIRVLIVGEGDRKRQLQARIEDLRLGNRVTLLGSVSGPRLHALLATCDCLCLPSVERTEAFGLVLLEAMRFAKPVVVSDVPGSGIGWVVKHKETGLLVRPGDAGDLARALQVMEKEQGFRKRMGSAAMLRFNDVFRIDRVARKIRNIYQDIVG